MHIAANVYYSLQRSRKPSLLIRPNSTTIKGPSPKSPPPQGEPSSYTQQGESSGEMAEIKRMKVKKGCLTVMVGLGDNESEFQRFVIPINYLYHPLFRRLLETAKEVYGFNSSGPLKLPCSVDDFQHLLRLVERESNPSKSYSGRSSFSLHSS